MFLLIFRAMKSVVWLCLDAFSSDSWRAGWFWLWDWGFRRPKQNQHPDWGWSAHCWAECKGKHKKVWPAFKKHSSLPWKSPGEIWGVVIKCWIRILAFLGSSIPWFQHFSEKEFEWNAWSDGCEKHLCFILAILKDQNPFSTKKLHHILTSQTLGSFCREVQGRSLHWINVLSNRQTLTSWAKNPPKTSPHTRAGVCLVTEHLSGTQKWNHFNSLHFLWLKKEGIDRQYIIIKRWNPKIRALKEKQPLPIAFIWHSPSGSITIYTLGKVPRHIFCGGSSCQARSSQTLFIKLLPCWEFHELGGFFCSPALHEHFLPPAIEMQPLLIELLAQLLPQGF